LAGSIRTIFRADSEIAGQIAWLYDGTWTAVIGSDLNGWAVEETLGSFEAGGSSLGLSLSL
jgi:hypothetical protein